MPVAAWKLKAGEARYLTGGSGDALYFGTPLTGDFEVKCQLTTNGGRGIHLIYGGVGLRLVADGSGYLRQEVGRSPAAKTVLKEKIPNWKASVEYRLVVKDSTMATFINGHQIHREKLPLHPDPWLAIETNDGRQNGIVQNLQILSRAAIPASIELSQGAGLDSWRPRTMANELPMIRVSRLSGGGGTAIATWSKQNDEIKAAKLPKCEGSYRESVLQYHRPLVDDGEVKYEFFYEPGKTEVHPAIDRIALLLRPEGVHVHRLTDAQYDARAWRPITRLRWRARSRFR